MASDLNYDGVGATRPDDVSWAPTPPSYRRYERSVRIGHGSAHWEYAATEVLRWGVKTRSGFTVVPAHESGSGPLIVNTDYVLMAHAGPLRFREPVRVVAVSERPDRCGFAYGTRRGHPVRGEEAFIVHRGADGDVWLTLRSLTRSAAGPWRFAFPVLLVAQRFYRRRYLRALTEPQT